MIFFGIFLRDDLMDLLHVFCVVDLHILSSARLFN